MTTKQTTRQCPLLGSGSCITMEVLLETVFSTWPAPGRLTELSSVSAVHAVQWSYTAQLGWDPW
jgi:hypothetical protein